VEILTPGQAADAGLSRSGLYRAAATGRLERIGRGLYRPSDAASADWDWIEAASRRRDATICLASGLAYYDLTDAIPRALDIAIPRGTRIPGGNSAISWHLFDRATFSIGRDAIEIPGTSLPIWIYSAERCIVDAFRLRNSVGYELGRDALREWLRRGGKPGRLMEIATVLPRAKEPLLRMLEALE
jgi:predicted transcriptional regulator of viral defense system